MVVSPPEKTHEVIPDPNSPAGLQTRIHDATSEVGQPLLSATRVFFNKYSLNR